MLLKNGIVVSGLGCTRQDIRMDEGRILQTGAGLNPLEGEAVMDVSGCLVAPGGIDAHTHFDMPMILRPAPGRLWRGEPPP